MDSVKSFFHLFSLAGNGVDEKEAQWENDYHNVTFCQMLNGFPGKEEESAEPWMPSVNAVRLAGWER